MQSGAAIVSNLENEWELVVPCEKFCNSKLCYATVFIDSKDKVVSIPKSIL